MRPLDPDERAEIRARNPAATDADLERFDALLIERAHLEREALEVVVSERPEAARAARVSAVDAELADLRARVLPAWDEAMSAVAARRVAADEAEDGEPPVG